MEERTIVYSLTLWTIANQNVCNIFYNLSFINNEYEYNLLSDTNEMSTLLTRKIYHFLFQMSKIPQFTVVEMLTIDSDFAVRLSWREKKKTSIENKKEHPFYSPRSPICSIWFYTFHVHLFYFICLSAYWCEFV